MYSTGGNGGKRQRALFIACAILMTQKYIQADFELWLSKFCKKKVPQNPPRLLSVCLLYNSESLCKAGIERHRRRLLLSQSSCNVFYGT